GRAAARILGNTHDPAWHVAFEGIARGEEGRVRPAVAERYAEPLRAANSHVRAKLARWPEDGQAQQIRRHGHKRTLRMCLLDETGVVEHLAESGRILHQRAEYPVAELKGLVVPGHHFDAQGPGTGLQHVYRLR